MKRMMRRYEGAGILFVFGDPCDAAGMQVLLGSRRRSGIWTIPGGGREAGDADSWETAVREVREEFGPIPDGARRLGQQRYPFAMLGFDWTTHVVRLEALPEPGTFPWRAARDFHREFRTAEWFPLLAIPPRTHLLLLPLIWKLQLGWL